MRICGTVAILFGMMIGSPMARTQVPARTTRPETKQRARIAFSHILPKLDGDHLKATLVEVSYDPGESSPPHSHPCAVIGYVLQGTLQTQVRGEPAALYKTGESFYEAPPRSSRHLCERQPNRTGEAPGLLRLRSRHAAQHRCASKPCAGRPYTRRPCAVERRAATRRTGRKIVYG